MTDPPLDPPKSTVYVANLPYELKTCDIQKIFEKYGEIVKVTLLTVKETRRSKGVAFILFRFIEDAKICVNQANNSQMFGQPIKVSIARDNGRRPNLNVLQNPFTFHPGSSREPMRQQYFPY